jgi:hypothetical protein
MKALGKYSFGMGDRFEHQASAQLSAILKADEQGVEITPVWNKSNREHTTIGTQPWDVRIEADTAVKKAGFRKPYFVDADHINFDTVDRFIESSDFFTIDVASYIGKKADEDQLTAFGEKTKMFTRKEIAITSTLKVSTDEMAIKRIAEKYLFAAKKAGDIYRKIEAIKGKGRFITEVSMDEVPNPQTPLEMLFILKMLADENIPVQTVAPKFSGRFNKGVDYVGDPLKFAEEFEADLLIIDFAIKEFGLPEKLKMSVHSGSDKFAIYPHIGRIIRKHNKGIHIKTAGTTWLEEIIGLAMSGGEALQFAKEIYAGSLHNIEELCAPYADVIDIDVKALPSAATVNQWSSQEFAGALMHDPGNSLYDPNMRQLIHVAYKLAAKQIDKYYLLLETNKDLISQCVFDNIYRRHICRLFDIS